MSLSNYRLYISPYFLTRYYLLRDIKEAISRFRFEGHILDVGCGQKPYLDLFKYSTKYIGIDFPSFSQNKDFAIDKPDYYFGDKYTKDFLLTFPDNSFSHTVAFQTLEHHPEPFIMAAEMVRVTKPGGYIMISVPFLGGLHEEPHDYQRFTKYGLTKLFERHACKVTLLKSQCSLCSTIVMLLSEQLNSFAGRSSVAYYIACLLFPIILVLSYTCLLLDRFIYTDKIVTNYLIVAKK